jgi:hypothetical protein
MPIKSNLRTIYNSTPPTLLTGEMTELQSDTRGSLKVNLTSENNATGSVITTNPTDARSNTGINGLNTVTHGMIYDPVANAWNRDTNTVTQGKTEYVKSAGNSTTVQLGALATFTGTIQDVLAYPSILLTGTSDTAMTYTVNQFQDVLGTKLVETTTFTRLAGQPINSPIQIAGNYLRVLATNNGAGATTTLVLDSYLGTMLPLPSSLTNNGNLKVAIAEGGSPTTSTYNAISPTLVSGSTAPLQSNINGQLLTANPSAANLDTNIGARADTEATSNIGVFSLISLVKRLINTTLAFGQKTMANSLPVVLASDQSAVTVTQTSSALLLARIQGISAIGAAPSNPVTAGGVSPTGTSQAIQTDPTGYIYTKAINGVGSLALGAFTLYRNTSLTNTFATVKATTGNVYGINVINPNAAPVYIKFYDTATPVFATSTPIETILIGANSAFYIEPKDTPISFFQSNSIKVTVVTGLADTNAVAPVTPVLIEIKYI